VRQIIQKVLIFVAIAVALISSLLGPSEIAEWVNSLSQPRGTLSGEEISARIILFLLATFFIEVLIERSDTFNKIDNVEDVITNTVKPFFRRFNRQNSQSRFHELQWKYVLNGSGNISGTDTFIVNRENSLSLWRDCIVEVEVWEALSYASDLWQKDETEKSLAFHEAIMKHATVTRIFVFDTDSDRREFEGHPNAQRILSMGNVHWILKKELLIKARERVSFEGQEHELIDFAIANKNDYILWFQLGSFDHNKLRRAVVTVDSSVVSRARNIFDVALANSETFTFSSTNVNHDIQLEEGDTDIFKAFFGLTDKRNKVAFVLPSFPINELRSTIRLIVERHRQSNEGNTKLLDEVSSLLGINLGKSTRTVKILGDIKDSALAQVDVQAFAELRELFSKTLNNQPGLFLSKEYKSLDYPISTVRDYNVVIAVGLFSNEFSMNVGNFTRDGDNARLPFRLFLEDVDAFDGKTFNRNTIAFRRSEQDDFQFYQTDEHHDYALVAHVRDNSGKTLIIIGGIGAHSTERVGEYISSNWQEVFEKAFPSDVYLDISKINEFAILLQMDPYFSGSKFQVINSSIIPSSRSFRK
jgi:hypothetical protein